MITWLVNPEFQPWPVRQGLQMAGRDSRLAQANCEATAEEWQV